MTQLLVLGAGPMAAEYVRVLKALGVHFVVVGRGAASAARLRDRFHVEVRTGGLDQYLSCASAPFAAILAVPVEYLASTTQSLAHAGTKRILVEKPGSLNTDELRGLMLATSDTRTQVWIAYNRRFLQSTLVARDLVKEDGGVTSFSFEFSEWVDKVVEAPASPHVKETWVVANSSHVIDLAFYLGGAPTELASWTRGSLSWHRTGDRFAGAGLTDSGALFSYRSDWLSPGRWRVEIGTRNRRILLSPLETLQQMVHGSLEFEAVRIDDDVDRNFKPGLFHQTSAFLQGPSDDLCTLEQQLERMHMYEQIAGYASTRPNANIAD